MVRGFTGHEHLDEFGLINMNGRVYDPMLGMFLSPDNYIQAPDFTQNYNRYAYAWGNPMMYTDPDGEWIQYLISGIIGGITNVRSNADNIHSFKDWLAYYAIGNLAGGMAASANNMIDIPILSEAASGYTGGFITRTLNSYYQGATPLQSIDAGARAGLIGGGVGSVVGAASFGLQALMGISWESHENYSGYAAHTYPRITLGEWLTGSSSVNTSGMLQTPLTIPLEKVFETDVVASTSDEVVDGASESTPDYVLTLEFSDDIQTEGSDESYLDNALKFEGAPYLTGGMTEKGMDCSGLVNRATGHETRVWTTSMGDPPGNWNKITVRTSSYDNFFADVKKGDLFVWPTRHAAFYAGDEQLFHAHGKTGTRTGYTNDIREWWFPNRGYPKVYRQTNL